MALSAFPTLNASLSEDRKSLLQHPSHNIGVAMDTSKGLLVPCIASVEEMSVLDIAEVRSTLLWVQWCCSLSGGSSSAARERGKAFETAVAPQGTPGAT